MSNVVIFDVPDLFTLYHHDPVGQDSCGWFPKAKHGNSDILNKIAKDFDEKWDKYLTSWFDKDGKVRYFSLFVGVEMFETALLVHFNYSNKKKNKFMRKYLYDIISFLLNNFNNVTENDRYKKIQNYTLLIYGFIVRYTRPWYKHPVFHLHHWKFSLYSN